MGKLVRPYANTAMKPIYWIFFAVVMLGMWIVWEWPTQQPVLIMCDVGQGDAILINQGFSQILIDTGSEPNKLMLCLSQHIPFWDRKLELVVLTHPEIDHMGAFAEIMQAYAVKTVLASPMGNDTQEFINIYHTISYSSIMVLTARQGQVMQLGGARLSVLWPPSQENSVWQKNYSYKYHNISSVNDAEKTLFDAENPNESSVVLEIELNNQRLLLTGDISTKVELALIDQGLIDDIDILKVAHHGSKTSSQDLFLDTTKPELALISAGKQNRYGHPHSEVVLRLTERNIPYMRTDENGSIPLILDKNSIVAEKYSRLPDWLSLSLQAIYPLYMRSNHQ